MSTYQNNDRMVERSTHKLFEDHIYEEFKGTPDYSIGNVKGYDNFMIGKFHLIPDLVIPSTNNTILDRFKRLKNERLYAVDCNISDKVVTLTVILGIIISLYLLYTERSENITKVYAYEIDDKLQQLKDLASKASNAENLAIAAENADTEDRFDLRAIADKMKSDLSVATMAFYNSDKQQRLDNINKDNKMLSLNITKTVCTSLSAVIIAWNIFKRTTEHRAGHGRESQLSAMRRTKNTIKNFLSMDKRVAVGDN